MNTYPHIHVTANDANRLSALAGEWMEIAQSPDIAEKKRLWKATNDLKQERPMLLFETFMIAGYIGENDLFCTDTTLRSVEKHLLHHIRHYREVKDDMVIDPYFRMGWETSASNYGVDIVERHAENSMAYLSNFPIRTPGDISKLRTRRFFVEKEATLNLAGVLDEIFGKTLPVKTGNRDTLSNERGYYPFNGLYSSYLTMDLFKLIGNDNLLLWTYDHPDSLNEIMRYLTDDRKRQIKWMIDEDILTPNTDGQFGGPFSYGYVSGLPGSDKEGKTEPADCWIWSDSQETAMISPAMFNELFLPYIAEIANQFGHTYYGCCEPVDDRIEYILKAINNIRVFSVSAWNKDYEKLAQVIGRDYVFCSKPNPSLVSGKRPLWNEAEKEVANVWKYAKNSNVEFVVRDLYDVGGDNGRGAIWTRMIKKVIGL